MSKRNRPQHGSEPFAKRSSLGWRSPACTRTTTWPSGRGGSTRQPPRSFPALRRVTTNHHDHATHRPARYGKAKRAAQIGLSAVTYLMLCIRMGPHRAGFFVAASAILTVWIWLCYRFPLFGIITMIFLSGFIGGLFGWRGGYYGYRRR